MSETIRDVVARICPDAIRGQAAPEHSPAIVAASLGPSALALLGPQCAQNLLVPYAACSLRTFEFTEGTFQPDAKPNEYSMAAESMIEIAEVQPQSLLIKFSSDELMVRKLKNHKVHVPMYFGPTLGHGLCSKNGMGYCDRQGRAIIFLQKFQPVCVLPCGLLAGKLCDSTVGLGEVGTVEGDLVFVKVHPTTEPFVENAVWDNYGKSYPADMHIRLSTYWCEYSRVHVREPVHVRE